MDQAAPSDPARAVGPGRRPAELLAVAAQAARTAGALLVEGQHHRRTSVETKSSPTDMVSDMDRAAETAIRAVLADARPGDTVLGEEQGEEIGPGSVRWIVDPLDGTTNYLYGFPAWSVSVAAEAGGQVVAGVVFDPGRDELFGAVRGGGATCNGSPLRLRASPPLATALVATGFAYERQRRAEQARWAATIIPAVRDIRRAGSAALDLCWVAAGRLDAYYEDGTHVWDWAAGALIAEEAGAWVGGFDGGPPGVVGLLAAAPALAAPMRVLLAEAGALARPTSAS